ncbi:MAG: nucleoside 2-deoxyribosyltransferase domain-containing protein [Bacteroidaceae bacterium]|nr:nucleoside 2-deoxyribosyltransferase domain-containing protein [Bacteroidaceae bacterium]
MKVITAPEKYTVKDTDILVFLAGGITGCPDWQQEVIKYLQEFDASPEECSLDDLVIFNPRREDFPINDPSAASTQISWEFQWLERADIFSMYFANSTSDQPICMYELGRNIARMQMRFPTEWSHRIVISLEKGYKRENDVMIQTRLATNHSVRPIAFEQGTKFHAHRIYDAYVTLKYQKSL